MTSQNTGMQLPLAPNQLNIAVALLKQALVATNQPDEPQPSVNFRADLGNETGTDLQAPFFSLK